MTEGLVSKKTPTAEETPPAVPKPSDDMPPKPSAKDKNITEEDKKKFLENMEKLEMYEPLFKSMDKLMHKVGVLIGNVK